MSRQQKIGEKLKGLRVLKNLSIKEMSEECKIPECTIHSYESGKRNPSDKRKELLANYFGVSIQDIFF